MPLVVPVAGCSSTGSGIWSHGCPCSFEIIMEAVSVINMFCSWQDCRSRVWGRIHGLRIWLWQTRRHGNKLIPVCSHLTLKHLLGLPNVSIKLIQRLEKGILFSLFFLTKYSFIKLYTCFLNLCAGGWFIPAGSWRLLCQERHRSSWTLHRGPSGKALPGQRDLQDHCRRGHQAPYKGELFDILFI